jgi:hypothetical protein
MEFSILSITSGCVCDRPGRRGGIIFVLIKYWLHTHTHQQECSVRRKEASKSKWFGIVLSVLLVVSSNVWPPPENFEKGKFFFFKKKIKQKCRHGNKKDTNSGCTTIRSKVKRTRWFRRWIVCVCVASSSLPAARRDSSSLKGNWFRCPFAQMCVCVHTENEHFSLHLKRNMCFSFFPHCPWGNVYHYLEGPLSL